MKLMYTMVAFVALSVAVTGCDKEKKAEGAKVEAGKKADDKKADDKKADDKKADDKKADDKKADDKKAEAPKADDKKAEAPKADDKKAEAPKADDKKAEAPAAGDAKAEAPKADDKKAEAPAAGDAKAEAPKADDKKAEAPAAGDAKAEAPKADDKKAEAPAAAPASPGPVYFGVAKAGLVKLEGGKFTKMGKKPDSFKSVITAADGTLYVAAYTGIHMIKDGKSKKIGNYKSPGSVDHLALAPDGTLWGASFKGVSHYKDGKWTMTEKAKLGADVKLLKDIAIDKDGTPWVLSSNAIHKKEGDAWKTIPTTGVKKDKMFFDDMVFAADGTKYFAHSSGIIKHSAGAFSDVKLGFRPIGMRQMAIAPNGTVVARAFKEIVTIDKAGKVERYSAKNKKLKATQFEAVTIDAGGRIWAATDVGVAVIADGKVTEWPQGSIDELTGSVKALVVVGGGSALPTVGPVKVGKVSGKLIRDGEAVAGATVEICKRPSSMFRGTPCKEAPWKGSVTSGADGVFTFNDVPLGTYRFAIKAGDKWSTGWSDCCNGMKEGKTFDVGSLKLKSGK